MQPDRPIKKSDQITDRFNLAEAIGVDWKERAIAGSLDEGEIAALVSSNLETTNRLKETLGDDPKFAVEVAEILLRINDPSTTVKVVEVKGVKKVLIQRQIGNDIIYAFIYPNLLSVAGSAEKPASYFAPDKVGIFNPKTGKQFSIDRLINLGPKNLVIFSEFKGERHSYNYQYTQSRRGDFRFDTSVNFPMNSQEVGVLFHELGHQIRSKTHASKEFLDTQIKAKDINEGKTPATAQEMSQARQLSVQSERGADAIALTFFRELNRQGFDLASGDSVDRVRADLEVALKTYDETSFTPSDSLTNVRIAPQFSSESRAEVRKLQKLIEEHGIKENDLPNFDIQTGEFIGNNPKRQREIIEGKS